MFSLLWLWDLLLELLHQATRAEVTIHNHMYLQIFGLTLLSFLVNLTQHWVVCVQAFFQICLFFNFALFCLLKKHVSQLLFLKKFCVYNMSHLLGFSCSCHICDYFNVFWCGKETNPFLWWFPFCFCLFFLSIRVVKTWTLK